MSTLEALLEDDEDESQRENGQGGQGLQGGRKVEGAAALAQVLQQISDDSNGEESQLGTRLETMMLKFVQFLELNNAIIGRTGPPPEHVKETAEYGIRDLITACTDMSAEHVRIGAQHSMENRNETFNERVKELDASIAMQDDKMKQLGAAMGDVAFKM
ncbi:hypothetical protein L596_012234 [Steinernema carpocapsae]|uniref:Uncharacterized protein n=1 Tax=Steinernema carpocapsae TaxID=34508 RepID=A0A4U5NWN6_STECR|nr:hypothetical protein L596_012234 [Steinernema carpocapsae]